MSFDAFFGIIVLVMSVVIHEVSHGMAALSLGDQTAKYQGRLTLNPFKHIDLFGSIILPLLLVLTNAGFVFGWAKPVPYNPYNLRNQKWGPAVVAIAGPLSNFLIALFFGLLIRADSAYHFFSSNSFVSITASIVFINVLLAVFNMVPIPPLDGSKVLFSLLPSQARGIQDFLERYGFVLVILFVFFLWQAVSPLIIGLFSFLTGITP